MAGTVGGRSFTAVDAISGVSQDGMALILFTDFPGACAAVEARHVSENAQLLQIELGTTAAVGQYPAGGAPGEYRGFDAQCAVSYFDGSEGDTTITATQDGALTGTLDLTLGSPGTDMGHLRGSFTTAPCAAIGATVFDGATFACP